jgi:hypothetical protein
MTMQTAATAWKLTLAQNLLAKAPENETRP